MRFARDDLRGHNVSKTTTDLRVGAEARRNVEGQWSGIRWWTAQPMRLTQSSPGARLVRRGIALLDVSDRSTLR
jgi:hypothetical protein